MATHNTYEFHLGLETDINALQFEILTPAFVFLCILMVLGIPGNIISIVIYGLQLKNITGRHAIITLAICDIINCVMSIPVELYIMTRYFEFENAGLCKMSRFVTYTMNNGSCMILVAIAFERYRTICQPHKPKISKHCIKRTCVILVLLGALFASPVLWIYGIQTDLLHIDLEKTFGHTQPSGQYSILRAGNMTLQTGNVSIDRMTSNMTVIRRCLIDDRVKNTWFAYSHFGIISIGSTLILLILIIVYIQVARKILRLRNIAHSTNEGDRTRTLAKKKHATLVLFLITLAFQFTFLPFLIISNIRFFAEPGWYNSLSVEGKMVYHFFLRSYVFNCAVNPFIYCVSSPKFRSALCTLQTRMQQNGVMCNMCKQP